MTCEPTILDCRIQGALLPDTRVTFTEDDVAIDPSGYTWQVQGSPSSSRVQAWLKNTGISVVGTEIIIGWAAGDLGACTPGDWLLELTGLLGGKPRKAQMLITIDAEVV
jgi:hypothetical protein